MKENQVEELNVTANVDFGRKEEFLYWKLKDKIA